MDTMLLELAVYKASTGVQHVHVEENAAQVRGMELSVFKHNIVFISRITHNRRVTYQSS